MSALPSSTHTGSDVDGGLPAPERFSRDRTTVLLYVSLGLFGALQTVPGAVTPALRSQFGYGYTVASLHVTMYAVGSLVVSLAGPALHRRFGRRVLLLAGLLGMAGSCAALTLGRGAAYTIGAAAGAGLLGTLIILGVQGGLSDHHGERRAAAFAESNAAASLGNSVGPLVIGGAAASLGSWRWGVLVLAVAVVPLLGSWRSAHIPRYQPPPPVAEGRGRLSTSVRAVVLLVFAAVVVEWSVSYWGATYLRDVVELAPSLAVSAMVCFFGAMLAGRLLGSVLARRAPLVPLLAGALAVTGTGVLVELLGTGSATALVGLLFLGFGVSVLFPLGLSLAVSLAPERATLIGARCVTAGSSAVLLGPLAVGRAADAVGLRSALLVVPLALVVGTAALLVATAQPSVTSQSRQT